MSIISELTNSDSSEGGLFSDGQLNISMTSLVLSLVVVWLMSTLHVDSTQKSQQRIALRLPLIKRRVLVIFPSIQESYFEIPLISETLI